MAFENPIGNPLEPRNYSDPRNSVEPLVQDEDRADIGVGANHLGVVGDSSTWSTLGRVADAEGVSEWPPRRHLSLVPNDFDDLFDTVEEQWQERALCAQTDPEAFFPEKGGSTREAKRICQGCEVKAECLEFALHNDERFGIWGGLSERERRRLKRGII
ncbi:putative WhiB family regulatory protein [Gordonia rhizosphera NBRC 16068]|uniref:Transcriptional regulator WhiB n=1 Tax=Gordonia rhizosphera NBRC 16068 TaxID=1108045 RepID=K6WBC0_9ACTN|nr:putative WhiB family regulatory protein [Gordonia rhizosphera NBRC 16068]